MDEVKIFLGADRHDSCALGGCSATPTKTLRLEVHEPGTNRRALIRHMRLCSEHAATLRCEDTVIAAV